MQDKVDLQRGPTPKTIVRGKKVLKHLNWSFKHQANQNSMPSIAFELIQGAPVAHVLQLLEDVQEGC